MKQFAHSSALSAAALFLCCQQPCVAPAAQDPPAPREAENPVALEIDVEGTIVSARGGYFIRARGRAEVYRIVNPLPALLDDAAKSGRTVRIEARVVQGDNVAVERIDGKTYGQGETGER